MRVAHTRPISSITLTPPSHHTPFTPRLIHCFSLPHRHAPYSSALPLSSPHTAHRAHPPFPLSIAHARPVHTRPSHSSRNMHGPSPRSHPSHSLDPVPSHPVSRHFRAPSHPTKPTPPSHPRTYVRASYRPISSHTNLLSRHHTYAPRTHPPFPLPSPRIRDICDYP